MREKRWLRAAALLGGLSLVLVACGDDGGGGGEAEDTVSIVAWAGYIEDGSTDPEYDWVTQFEEDTGCNVEVKVAGTSDEMVSLMTGSDDYDLVTASGDASLRLINGGTVQEIDVDRIPSYDTVDERLQDAPWHTVDGKHYGVPYTWGSNVLLYNTDVFPEEPQSWDVVFEEQALPDGQSNSGRIEAYDGAIYIADAALYLMEHNPELGIEDPYELNQEQFDAAIDLLNGQRDLAFRYWHDVTLQVEDFTSEGVVASSSWPYQVNLLVADDQPVASTIPEEGATGWADTTLLATDAPHDEDCAYEWMEWSLNEKVQGDVAAWFGSVPAVPAACKGNELLTNKGCQTNGIDNFDQIEFWKTPTAECETQNDECIPYEQWVTKYVAVIGSQ